MLCYWGILSRILLDWGAYASGGGFPKFRDNAENDSPVRVRTYPGSVSYDDYELVIVPRVPS